MNKRVLLTEKSAGKKHKLKKHATHPHGKDVDLEFDDNDAYDIETLAVDELPTTIAGVAIGWFHNFGIKKNGQYIKKKYRLKIAGISNLGASKLVICDSSGVPQFYSEQIVDDMLELTDGDPAIGRAP